MSDLPVMPTSPTRRKPRAAHAAARTIRSATGVSPWPIILLAGDAKAETARAAAEASASELVDRTLWLSWGERNPDALGAVKGARFEIVEHDGTLDDFEDALVAALAQPRRADTSAKSKRAPGPHLIVIDGVSQLWESVKDWATENQVAASAGSYWFAVNDRWSRILKRLRDYDGPVLLIGRHDGEQLVGHRDLATDVDVLVELREDGVATVTATRTEPTLHGDLPDFEVETVWLLLKLSAVSS